MAGLDCGWSAGGRQGLGHERPCPHYLHGLLNEMVYR